MQTLRGYAEAAYTALHTQMDQFRAHTTEARSAVARVYELFVNDVGNVVKEELSKSAKTELLGEGQQAEDAPKQEGTRFARVRAIATRMGTKLSQTEFAAKVKTTWERDEAQEVKALVALGLGVAFPGFMGCVGAVTIGQRAMSWTGSENATAGIMATAVANEALGMLPVPVKAAAVGLLIVPRGMKLVYDKYLAARTTTDK